MEDKYGKNGDPSGSHPDFPNKGDGPRQKEPVEKKETRRPQIMRPAQKTAQSPRQPSGPSLTERFRRLVLDTPIEVLIGGVLVGALAGGVAYDHEASKKGSIPVAFSEIGKTKMRFARQDKKVPPLTLFYSTLNDSVMQVFEASNLAYANGQGSDEAFASELEAKISYRKRYNSITEYAQDMPIYARDALASVAVLEQAQKDIRPAINALGKAWDEHHRNVYKTVYETKRECDTDGKNCRNVTTSREEYDYTVHTYNYDEDHGKRAARLLEDFIQKYPHLRIDEQLIFAGEVHENNRQAMSQSRQNTDEGQEISEDQYVDFANVWATGSNYFSLMPKVKDGHAGVNKVTPQWSAASVSANNYYRYRTYSRSDSGPKEFQIAEAALDYAASMAKNINKITTGIHYAGTALPELSQKITRYVSSVQSIGQDDPEELREEIMDMAKKLYSENYAKGFDVYPSKWGMVLLWTVLGTLAGGGAGFGVDRYIDKNRDKFRSGFKP
ncbi:MAG: hypothetical protein H6867_06935 [Rhodospirillales bacterium]|nr:hypothetical protein [Rhodospirillales bacterium]MCB9995285.1 hypothetical protein [Rhodospirillales bacterium]